MARLAKYSLEIVTVLCKQYIAVMFFFTNTDLQKSIRFIEAYAN